MNELILLKNGEIALKGLNRHSFEDKLIRNAKNAMRGLGQFKFYKAQSTIYCEPLSENCDMDEAFRRLSKVFGVAALSRARVAPKDMGSIFEVGVPYLEDTLSYAKTFKVEARRSDKSFPFTSPQISAEFGGRLLEAYPHLTVDVHNPDVVVAVEIRDFAAYIRAGQTPGAGGVPVGSAGRAALLISGGIDSPVAGYMMAKRGIELSAVHFASPPYTGERARLKVVSLLEKVARYSGPIDLTVVEFTEIQQQILKNCPEELFTIIMRRFMMRIAQVIARQREGLALITGESLGQVASQTIHAITCTQAVCELPVFSPLIGMDKEEIIRAARRIDTFETSILPYEDCCTVFTPRHPRTRPQIAAVEQEEQKLDIDALVSGALEKTQQQTVYGYSYVTQSNQHKAGEEIDR